MAACGKLAREYEGVRLHTHLAENLVRHTSKHVIYRVRVLQCSSTPHCVLAQGVFCALYLHYRIDFEPRNMCGAIYVSSTEAHVWHFQEDVDYTLKMHGYRFAKYIKCVPLPMLATHLKTLYAPSPCGTQDEVVCPHPCLFLLCHYAALILAHLENPYHARPLWHVW